MLSALLFAVACAPQSLPSPEEAREGIQKGLHYLVSTQNSDGSWGHWRNPESEFWSNIESHRSWQAATTALGCLAMLETGQAKQHEAAFYKGLDFLLDHVLVKRPSDWDTDNTWAYVYGLEALTRIDEYLKQHPEQQERRIRVREVGAKVLDKLWQYQTPAGGWAYYDFETRSLRPSWATSFQTAVVVLGVLHAKRLQWDNINEQRFKRALKVLEHCRLPSGAYTYSVNAFSKPGGLENIDQLKGSLSRIQVCNLALYEAKLAGYTTSVKKEDLANGLRVFFKEHRFLDVARQKPIPHESFYYNSGYFYFFGHYYGARLFPHLTEEERRHFAPKMRREILKTQSKDGSMWDFYMNDYGKAYGVSYGVLTLFFSQTWEN